MSSDHLRNDQPSAPANLGAVPGTTSFQSAKRRGPKRHRPPITTAQREWAKKAEVEAQKTLSPFFQAIRRRRTKILARLCDEGLEGFVQQVLSIKLHTGVVAHLHATCQAHHEEIDPAMVENTVEKLSARLQKMNRTKTRSLGSLFSYCSMFVESSVRDFADLEDSREKNATFQGSREDFVRDEAMARVVLEERAGEARAVELMAEENPLEPSEVWTAGVAEMSEAQVVFAAVKALEARLKEVGFDIVSAAVAVAKKELPEGPFGAIAYRALAVLQNHAAGVKPPSASPRRISFVARVTPLAVPLLQSVSSGDPTVFIAAAEKWTRKEKTDFFQMLKFSPDRSKLLKYLKGFFPVNHAFHQRIVFEMRHRGTDTMKREKNKQARDARETQT